MCIHIGPWVLHLHCDVTHLYFESTIRRIVYCQAYQSVLSCMWQSIWSQHKHAYECMHLSMQKAFVMCGLTAARQAGCQACCMQLPTQICKTASYSNNVRNQVPLHSSRNMRRCKARPCKAGLMCAPCQWLEALQAQSRTVC